MCFCLPLVYVFCVFTQHACSVHWFTSFSSQSFFSFFFTFDEHDMPCSKPSEENIMFLCVRSSSNIYYGVTMKTRWKLLNIFGFVSAQQFQFQCGQLNASPLSCKYELWSELLSCLCLRIRYAPGYGTDTLELSLATISIEKLFCFCMAGGKLDKNNNN